jgi:hypothetical protein
MAADMLHLNSLISARLTMTTNAVKPALIRFAASLVDIKG